MKKNKSLIIILLIVVIGLVGITLAYFANTANITNEFKSREYGTTVTEEFTSPDNWLPGSTEPKTLTVTNSGNVDEAVRVSYVETWTSKNGDNLSLIQGNNRAAIINFNENGDWSPVTENNKTYYYYNYKLAPTEVTSTLLNSVTFNSAITNTNNCTTNETATGKQIVCSSTGDEYDGATYRLVFTVETVQYDKYADAWNTNVSIANSSKPLIVKGLKVNSADKTYETGDRTAMFAFSHSEIEQMKATTDYRYIGNIPNNYVKFNCDNDGTNCEVWRIIGVFEVDDGNGNYEQRIKLVRGSAFAETMEWDDNSDGIYSNNWPNASLNTFLNGDYLNRDGNASTYGLKELAQSQIADAKYYLGGGVYDSNSAYGSTEDIYSWERGTTVYDNSNSTYWKGKVGLMYASDMYMLYGKGVDDICYNNPNKCVSWVTPAGVSSSGWIYNSNLIEGQTGIQWTWLLSQRSQSSASVFYGSEGLYDIHTSQSIAVRPVVYLKPSIQITGGDGSELNPYTLSGN